MSQSTNSLDQLRTLSLDQLRTLRGRVQMLSESLEDDLKPFLHPKPGSPYHGTFIQKPKTAEEIDEKEKRREANREQMGRIDATTTSTVLMTLAMGKKLDLFYGKSKSSAKPSIETVISALYTEKWTSGGLKDLNKFSASLVFRCLGFLQRAGQSAAVDGAIANPHEGLKNDDLIKYFAEADPNDLKVGASDESNYPLTSTLAYWLIDAASELSWKPDKDAWLRWARWSTEQFNAQLSYVAVSDDASMDPVALAMAACLVSKLRELAKLGRMGDRRNEVEAVLPSNEQLREVLRQLFRHQGTSGIWPKYFPLFVYPDGGSVNYCFAFELLEALLKEFPAELLTHYLANLERAVGWCEKYRIRGYHKVGGTEYSGWNSGANLQALREGYPECWATAVVHGFLFKLEDVLTKGIQQTILSEFGSEALKDSEKEKRELDWKELVGSYLSLAGKAEPVKAVLEKEIFDEWHAVVDIKRRKRSALLFGPPGTTKTSVVKRLAAARNWPLVSINPSHFLTDGLEKIFGRANEIFRDLMDLKNVVVFFDEMDPLVQKREAGSDIHHQSLTTVFLPKLADLYNRNQVIFFMATNHIQQIDPAIRRPGRFDYLLFVGPPRWKDKYRSLTRADTWESLSADERMKLDVEERERLERERDAHDRLDGWSNEWMKNSSAETESVVSILDRFTYDETRALFDQIRADGGGNLAAGLSAIGQEKFRDRVVSWSQNYIVLWEKDGSRAEDYEEYLKDKKISRR